MITDHGHDFIITSKLHRPPLTRDHLHRQQLLARLDDGFDRALSLISAPAGYGKSTLASCWVESCGYPYGWVSLDGRDDDVSLFLHYLISGLRTMAEGCCGKTMAMLQTAHLPPTSALSEQLINDIDEMSGNFVIVLDDCHHLRDTRIHEVLTTLLQFSPASLHLLIVSRRDPPLPLASWRAKGMLTEIRTQDLRLSLDESSQFLQLISGREMDENLVTRLNEQTEGWVTGLRLAALTLLQREDLDGVLSELPAQNRYVIDYIVEELISTHSPEIQDCILKISILERFSEPLCERVCSLGKHGDHGEITSREFVGMLGDSSLFIIALDDHGEWYRHHHLIQAVLKRLLKKRFESKEIVELYRRASVWFREQGEIEEALAYLFTIKDNDGAAELVARYRHDLMNREQWYHLHVWLMKFPAEYLRTHLPLLLSKAWVYQRQARYSELFAIIEELDEQALFSNSEDELNQPLQGEVSTLRSFYYYSTGQKQEAEHSARTALKNLPIAHSSVRGFALIILSLALQMQGKAQQSQQVIENALKEEELAFPVYKTMLLAALCYGRWIAAELTELPPLADMLIDRGGRIGLPETIDVGRFFNGIKSYEQNDLDRAEAYLLPVVKTSVAGELVVPSIVTYCQSSFALALTYHGQGRPGEARDIADSAMRYMLDTGNGDLLEFCRGFQAELALRQGRRDTVESWLEGYEPTPLTPVYRFYTPSTTYIKALMLGDFPTRLKEAEILLVQMIGYHKDLHSTRMVIHLSVLQAALRNRLDDRQGALACLEEALVLAGPGFVIRPFIDGGATVEELLPQAPKEVCSTEFAELIIRACAEERAAVHENRHSVIQAENIETEAGPHAQPLSTREIEVLRKLDQGGRNKDIARSLYISTETVKRHLSTIYRKLDVANRHQALLQARKYGIL